MTEATWLDAGVPSDETGAVCEVVPVRAEDVDAAHAATQMLQLQWYDAKDDGSLTEFARHTQEALTSQIIYGNACLAHKPDLGPGVCPDLWAPSPRPDGGAWFIDGQWMRPVNYEDLVTLKPGYAIRMEPCDAAPHNVTDAE